MKSGIAIPAFALAALLLHCGRTGLDLDLGLDTTTNLDGGGDGRAGEFDSGYSIDDAGEMIKTLPDGRTVLLDGAPTGCCFGPSDPANCGACGHDCLGGACVAGVCQPVLLADAEFFPSTLALDDARIYWANRTDVDYGAPPASIVVRAMPKAGGAPTTLDTIVPGVATSMHREGNYLYFYRSIQWTVKGQAWEGSVIRMCTDGSCARTDLVSDIDNVPWEIALDATRIFYPNSLTKGMSDIPKGGGIETQVASFPTFFFERLAVDEQYLYMFAVPNDTVAAHEPVMVLRAAKDANSSAAPIMKGLIEGGDVLVDADAIYASDTKQIYRLPKTGPSALQPTAIAQSQGKPGYMAQDANRLYWLEFSNYILHTPSSLHWVRKDGTGGGSMTLAVDASQAPGLVVDDTSIYWVAFLAPLTPPVPAKGGIVRCTKPL